MVRTAILVVAAVVIATSNGIFGAYEHARQGLLKSSIKEVHAAAQELAAAAREAKQDAVAAKADALAATKDIAAARTAFSALSDEMIKYRASVHATKPVVVYCSMEKKSWLQPEGAITNPYVSPSMRTCGEIRN